jgi:hypothetical protein
MSYAAISAIVQRIWYTITNSPAFSAPRTYVRKLVSRPATIQQNWDLYMAENAQQTVTFSAELGASTAGNTHRLTIASAFTARPNSSLAPT